MNNHKWFRLYHPGAPAIINPRQYNSIGELLSVTCETYSNKVAFSNMATNISYKALDKLTAAFANFLSQQLNLPQNTRVAVMLPNILQYPVSVFGILRAGCVVVNINPHYTPHELKLHLQDSESEVIIILANLEAKLQEIIDSTSVKYVIVTEIFDLLDFTKKIFYKLVTNFSNNPMLSMPRAVSFTQVVVKFLDALKIGRQFNFRRINITNKDLAFLQYTGGTTGVIKAAMLSHGNILANLEQAYAWISPVLCAGREVVVTALPLYHIFALTANCLTFIKLGAKNVLVTNPRDIKRFVEILKAAKFTAITGVDTLYRALLDEPEFHKLNFNRLKIALAGGMALQAKVANAWQKLTDKPLIEAYGLTEASPAVCINPLNIKAYNGSVGLPLPLTEISIRDELGQELPFDAIGELWVKGPQVMQGYWRHEAETKAVLRNGWLATGDIATVSQDGMVKLIDRKKDMINVSGFKVYPAEVEDVIAKLELVREVAVTKYIAEDGELPKAYVVPQNADLTSEMIIEHCRKHLTNYKIPKVIEFREELPKSLIGKILKRQLEPVI